MAAREFPALTPVLHELRRVSSVEVAFGGLATTESDHFVVRDLVGATTDGLQDLKVHLECGVGGKAAAHNRPIHVRDYPMARGITHHYDLAVGKERLHAMFAVPIRIPNGPRGAVYGALRHSELFGDRVIDRVCSVVRRFEYETAIELEVNRRVAAITTEIATGETDRRASAAPAATSAAYLLADICAELSCIASSMPEGSNRAMITALIDRLSPTADKAARSHRHERSIDRRPTPRERDVLLQVASGLTNKAIAIRLGIGSETVKSSLKSSMRKLGASNRTELVTAARQAGLIN